MTGRRVVYVLGNMIAIGICLLYLMVHCKVIAGLSLSFILSDSKDHTIQKKYILTMTHPSFYSISMTTMFLLT